MPISNVMGGHSRHMLRFTFKKKQKNKKQNKTRNRLENRKPFLRIIERWLHAFQNDTR